MADKKKVKRLEELRAMSADELTTVLEATQRAIYNIRRERLSKPQQNVKASRNNRKEIARVLTLQRERELAQARQNS